MIIHVVSSRQAPECIKETDVSDSKFRQLFATHFSGCYYRQIIFNLDYFCMGPLGSSTLEERSTVSHMCQSDTPMPVLI